jgi:acetoacetyl-CoA synthetase
VLYSSGTTGRPKAIVHSHGGMLLEHLKQQGLHLDLGPGDRFLWFTTTGWMMWNVVVSGLLLGATAVLYDGSPSHPDAGALFRLAAEEGVTYLGTSAAYLPASMALGLAPGREHDLAALRSLGSTGSPLSAEAFAWVYAAVKDDLWLASLSGGTDVCSGLLGGVPLLPVRAGEIQAPLLGVAAAAFDEAGRPVREGVGELVVTRPLPSMPLGFLDDPDGERYRAAYFAMYPGVWRHGDWVRFTPSGGAVIQGRSDATLNRRGVRIGTAEIYRVVEALDGVQEALVVDVERGPAGASEMLLFVAPAPGRALDAALEARIRGALRETLTPRHVPDRVLAVGRIPHTLNGKKIEVPVRRILRGERAADVVSRDALDRPDALDALVAAATAATDPPPGPA